MCIHKFSSMYILVVLCSVSAAVAIPGKDSYQLQRAHSLLAAVHAADKCIQIAQPEEGEKGEV